MFVDARSLSADVPYTLFEHRWRCLGVNTHTYTQLAIWTLVGYITFVVFLFLYLFLPKFMQMLFVRGLVKKADVSAAWIAAIDVCSA